MQRGVQSPSAGDRVLSTVYGLSVRGHCAAAGRDLHLRGGPLPAVCLSGQKGNLGVGRHRSLPNITNSSIFVMISFIEYKTPALVTF